MKIGINGFGKVGQALLQRLDSTQQIDVVAYHGIGLSAGQAAALLGSAAFVSDSGDLVYGHRTIKWLAERDHRQIGWDKHDIEAVLEASRLFQRKEMVEQSAGGRIGDPDDGDLRGEPPDLTLVRGVNDSEYRRGMTVSALAVIGRRPWHQSFALSTTNLVSGRTGPASTAHRTWYLRPSAEPTDQCRTTGTRPTRVDGLRRGYASDDPEATFVTVWLDISTSVAADEHQVRAAMHELAAGYPRPFSALGSCLPRLATPLGSD